MFRIIVEYVPAPLFWMLCDDSKCGCYASGPADLSSQESTAQSQTKYLTEVKQQGWGIGLMGQFCPGHYQRMKEQNSASQQQIRPSSMADLEKFKGLVRIKG